MSAIVSSPIALDLLLALTQRPAGARLGELAEAAGVSLSTAQAAIRVLLADKVVERVGDGRPRYRPRHEYPALTAMIELAARYPAPRHAIDLLLCANPSVEFAARDKDGYIVVVSVLAEPAELIALQSLLETVRRGRAPAFAVDTHQHDDLAELLRDDETPRIRARAARIIKGTIPRSFPDRRHHARTGKPLGRPHPKVPHVPQRALRAIARGHGLRRIALFGSAVRSDFRPDSDIDVLIEPRPDARLSLLGIAGIEFELEKLFGRDVDVLEREQLRPRVRQRVERELVPIYG